MYYISFDILKILTGKLFQLHLCIIIVVLEIVISPVRITGKRKKGGLKPIMESRRNIFSQYN